MTDIAPNVLAAVVHAIAELDDANIAREKGNFQK